MKKCFSTLLKTLLTVVLVSMAFVSCTSTGDLSPAEVKDLQMEMYIEYYNLAEEYMKMQKYDSALPLYEKARPHPDLYWAIIFKIARIYVFQKDWENAVESYRELLDRDPENCLLKESLAYTYAMKGDREDALLIYEELLSIYPENETYITNSVSVLCSMMEIKEELSEKELKAIDKQEKDLEKQKEKGKLTEEELKAEIEKLKKAKEPKTHIDEELRQKARVKFEKLKELYPENKNLSKFEDLLIEKEDVPQEIDGESDGESEGEENLEDGFLEMPEDSTQDLSV